jgi:hypothetical protein
MLVMFVKVLLVSPIAVLVDDTNSPTRPAAALSPATVPTMLGFVMLAPVGMVTVPVNVGEASGA